MFSQVVDDVIGLSDTDVVARLRELEEQRRCLDAETALLVSVIDQRGIHHVDGHHNVNELLRAELNWSRSTASTYRSLSRAVDQVPGFGDAWCGGRFGLPQAVKLAQVYANRRVRDRLEAAAPVLLCHAEELTYPDFVIVADKFVELGDADGAHIERDNNIEHRNARVLAVGGSLDMGATGGDPLMVAEMIEIFDKFCDHEFAADVTARKQKWPLNPEEHPLPRTAPQRRFDALVAMFRAAAQTGCDSAVGPQASLVVNVVVDIDTWTRMLTEAGLITEHDLDGNPIDPFTGISDPDRLLADLLGDPDKLIQRRCETSNGVALHPHDVLRAALTGHIRRSVVDAKSVTIDHGRKQRLFTGPAREAAKLLVRHCQHPGCELLVDKCEIDHMNEWDRDGGGTDQRNADIRCSTHNRAKHQKRWQTKRATNGRTYTIRRDGTIMLPVGARTPSFEPPDEIDGSLEPPIDLLERIRTVTQHVDDLITQLGA